MLEFLRSKNLLDYLSLMVLVEVSLLVLLHDSQGLLEVQVKGSGLGESGRGKPDIGEDLLGYIL